MKSIADRKLDPFPKIKKQDSTQTEAKIQDVGTTIFSAVLVEQPVDQEFPHSISLRLDVDLLETLKNAIVAAQTTGDYQFTSMSSGIRAALQAYAQGMQLAAVVPPGVVRKKRSFTLNGELKAFYERIPSRKRAEIIERIIRTFLKNGMTWTGPE